MIKSDKIRQHAFFSKRFIGLGIDLDFQPLFMGRDPLFTFQITLFYFRYWIVVYE